MCNDGSTDHSFAICKEYAARYPGIIILLHNPENLGLLLTRRRLFAAASGEYVLCLDSDDQLEPNALVLLKECVVNTEADMVLFNALCINVDQTVAHLYLRSKRITSIGVRGKNSAMKRYSRIPI